MIDTGTQSTRLARKKVEKLSILIEIDTPG